MFVNQLTEPQRSDYVLIVDGSFTMYPKPKGHAQAGAGLVLAREDTESVVACCSASFLATSSDDAEYEAIRRGNLWAPLGVVWSDNATAIRASNGLACYIRPQYRDPLHHLAHRLANIGRLGDWDKLDKVWVPGEVWP